MIYLKKVGFLVSLFILLNLCLVSAFDFYGYTYSVNGSILANTNISITAKDQNWQEVWHNSTYSDENGFFNLSVEDNMFWTYQPTIKHYADPANLTIDFVGQSLPDFPFMEMQRLGSLKFYLKEGGTINISAVNSTNDYIPFYYQIKDQLLGFPVKSSWITTTNEAIVYVQADRSYSVMIYPLGGLPVSFDLNNITAYENNTVEKVFNVSETLVRVTGYIEDFNSVLDAWEEFTIIPYLIEPGNMIFFDEGELPSNMSNWWDTPTPENETFQGDEYNLNTGWFNISLPGPAEGGTFLLFASAKNGSYYGGFRNITLHYGDTPKEMNFTMYGLFGEDYSNISVHQAIGGQSTNLSAQKQEFRLVNATTNETLSNTQAHVEIILDYSNYGAFEFGLMSEVSATGTSTFSIPLLNVTGIKEMNVYSQNFASRRLEYTPEEIATNTNISMTPFNPGDIEGGNISIEDVFVKFYISNSSCDVPSPPEGCLIGDFSGDEFNPLSAVIGGGNISFRMGSGGISVHYANVDLLASGPPDALFDDEGSAQDLGTGDAFGRALRFGAQGPTIYDYVLISIPYSETAGSGLDDSKTVNMTIPTFYDNDWNVIWNVSENGSVGADLGANYSHYYTHSSEWETLMGNNSCVTNSSSEWFNVTSPCYINTANNTVWIRLPHFSGTSPAISGVTVAESQTTSTTTDSSGSSSSTTYSSVAPSDISSGITRILMEDDSIVFSVNGESHQIVVDKLESDSVTLIFYSDPIKATLKIGESKKVDVNGDGLLDILVELKNIDVPHKKAEIYFEDISPQKEPAPPSGITEETKDSESEEATEKEETTPKTEETTPTNPKYQEETSSKLWIWILGIVIILVIAFGFWFIKRK